jgi:choline dehydrogenase
MEQVREIQQMPPLVNQTEGEVYPGINVTGEALKRYIHAHNLPNSHWVGSTKMGAADDPLAVVDEELRVRGVQGLRIVDSGVIPFVPNGNTHSTVCVVASRAADLIADFRRRPSTK